MAIIADPAAWRRSACGSETTYRVEGREFTVEGVGFRVEG